MANDKAQKPKKQGFQIHKIYQGGKARNQTCPKCGPGIFLAEHNNRKTCGKCKYMEKK